MFKLLYNCTHFTCQQGNAQIPSSQASTVQYVKQVLLMYKLDLDKGEEPEIKLPASIGSQKNRGDSKKTSASLTMLKPLTVWITKQMWKIFKKMGIPDHLTCLLGNLYQVKQHSQNWTWNKGQFQSWERSVLRLYAVTLLI